MSIEFKLKFSVSKNYPFPCSDFTIQAVFLDNVRFDNLNDKILLIIQADIFEMSTIKIYPLSPSEQKNCTEEDVLEQKGDFAWKFLKISQKCCHTSRGINVYTISCSLYFQLRSNSRQHTKCPSLHQTRKFMLSLHLEA